MISSDRRARIMLACAVDSGDLAAAELMQNLGAEGAWAKIVGGALGEPAVERAARVKIDIGELPLVITALADEKNVCSLARPGQRRDPARSASGPKINRRP